MLELCGSPAMGDSIELETVRTNGSHRDADLSEVRVAGNEELHNGSRTAPEEEALLSVQTSNSNGASLPSHNNRIAGNQNGSTHRERSAVCKIKEELNEVVCGKVIRLWMIIVFLILLIVGVIILSLFLCTVIYEDPDENFNPSSFKVPLHLNGSFTLPNMVFTDELLTLSSSKSEDRARQLEEKLTDLYRSSPALGRYFSAADILAFRNGSVVADYKLTFVMPEEEQDLLTNFTLSRNMVFNVFRQFLYEQGLPESDPMYIDVSSLSMFLSR